MNQTFKKFIPHCIAFLVFLAASVIYFFPVLQGKQIYQSDIVQYTGMAKEQNDFRKETGQEPYWTNSAFGGMPTYQLGANYPHNYVKKLDNTIRFLPRPADYLFLYFIGFYILLLALGVRWQLALTGALAFGLSTYLIIILGVGHNAKAHAIGYFAFVVAGVLLVFKRKYIAGFLLTAFAMALEIGANHFQMTYYLGFLLLCIGVVYFIDAFKKRELPHFFKSVGILVLAVILGISANTTNLLATQEYTKWSTRGKSELTINPDGTPKESTSGLNKEYITEYSYGIAESLNLFVPRLFGGSNSEKLGEGSNTYKYLVNQGVPRDQAKGFTEGLPTYWGAQPIVAAPAYIGAVVVFLFVLALFLVKGKHKWWLLAGILLSLLLSWGKNLSFVTDFMIENFPLYNKFRAVSSIQVILELCVPILAVLGLSTLFDASVEKKEKLKALKWSSIITAGLAILLLLAKGFFNFEGAEDAFYRQQFSQMGLPQLMDIIVSDREKMYTADTFRSLLFVLAAAAACYSFVFDKLKSNVAIAILAVLAVLDLGLVAKRYVNEDDFVQARLMEKPFQENAADLEILKDTSHFRVFEPSAGMAGARASYFHKAIGGYHAAKPGRMQELYDYQIAKNNVGVLNMLNVKYIIQQNENGYFAARNPFANGNAWFVEKIIPVNNATEEMKALDSLNVKTEAVVDVSKFPQDRVVFGTDSLSEINLIEYKPNYLKYTSKNQQDGLAVFSEVYYPYGWQVTVNGEEANHFRANYVLRALALPAGEHTIEFSFEPDVVKKGSTVSLISSILLFLALIGGVYAGIRKK